jgi:radical SAM superfamily enzyme YgiQ (UPF0313 family)
MKRIVFLQPPSPPGMNMLRDYAGGYGTVLPSDRQRFGHDGRSHYVPALLNSATIAKERFEVTLIDAQVRDLDIGPLVREIAAIRPDYVVGVFSLPSFEGDIAIMREVRKHGGPRAVLGFGTVLKGEWKKALSEGALDFVMLGDPEAQLMGLLDALETGAGTASVPGIAMLADGIPVRTEGEPRLPTLDVLPIPDYGLLDLHKYWYHELTDRDGLALVYTTRGCPFACGYYCPYPYGFGRKVRFRDPKLVGDELEILNRKHGVTGILFRDQVFTIKRDHTVAVCKEIIARGLDLQWVCETKYDRVDPDLLRVMKRAGCRSIHYGLESGDEELFWTVGKPGGKGSATESLQQFQQAVADTKAAGILGHVHTIVGLPGETKKSIKNTRARLNVLGIDSVQVGIITPYPGTGLYDDAVKNRWIRDDSYSSYTASNPVLEYEGFTQQDMIDARDQLSADQRRRLGGAQSRFRRVIRQIVPRELRRVLNRLR